MIVEIVRISKTVVNKHNQPCRVGFTADYIDEEGVFRKGQTIYTEQEELFEQFIVGLKVEL